MKRVLTARAAALMLAGLMAVAGTQVLSSVRALADDAVIAKLNGVEIKESDLKLAEAEAGGQLASLPADKRRRVLLEFLIEMRLFADAADAEKITTGPDYEKLLAYWTTRAKRDMYYEKSIRGGVSEQLARSIYDDRVKEIPQEEEVNARHILVDSEVVAQEVFGKIGNGEDFATLAATYSKDPGSKADGGNLGYFTKGQMVKEFEDAAFALKKGEVSKPVKSKFGWHIIKLEDKRTKPLPTFDEVKDQIIESMAQQNGQKAATDLRAKAQIEYVDTAIAEEVRKETALNAAKKKLMEEQLGEQIKQMESQGKGAGEPGKAGEPEKKD